MRAYEFIFEGYKEAQSEFTQIAPPDEVIGTINAYKVLVNKNQVQGTERNIDFWRKQGWELFKKFVDTKQVIPTPTQLKRSKLVGKSITLQENNEWLIVIPLNKDASCFHGKGSDWCTTKQNQSHFENYFYRRNVILIYCLQKDTGNMWAIACHESLDNLELFDKQDNSIDENEFQNQTGLDPREIADIAISTHKPTIDQSKDEYRAATRKLSELLGKFDGSKRDFTLEKLLLYCKLPHQTFSYVHAISSTTNKKINFPKELTIPMLSEYPQAIRFLADPSEYEQLIAVNKDKSMLEEIENPTDSVCIAVLKKDARYINKIPLDRITQEMCDTAVDQNGYVLKLIPDKFKTHTTMLTAVKRDGDSLQFVPESMRDYEICITAVNQCGDVLQYVPDKLRNYEICKTAILHNLPYWNFSEIPEELPEYYELCKLAVNKNGEMLQSIPENRITYELCLDAINQHTGSFRFVPKSLPEYKELEEYARNLWKKRYA